MNAVIDRIENNVAVLLVGEKETVLNVPLGILPENVREGTWLRIDFTIDEQGAHDRFMQNKLLLEKIKRKVQRGR